MSKDTVRRPADECATAGCTDPAASHAVYTATGGQYTLRLCRPCVRALLAGHGTHDGQRAHHVADHPTTVQCARPDARWVEDRCEIPGLTVLT